MNNIAEYNPTERFTDVVEAYTKFRPGYPIEIIEILKNNYPIGKNCILADIGSGTGIFSKLFVEAGFFVYGVEPNDMMRKQSENELAQSDNFKTIDGTAEETSLDTESVDVILAAQSFHWFEPKKALREFYRILKPEGHIVIVWNERNSKENPFMSQYEKLLIKYCPDYKETNHKRYAYETMKELFEERTIDLYMISNFQDLNSEGLIGRVKSCSYCPKSDHKNFKPLMEGLTDLFSSNQSHGLVRFDYNTVMYVISKKCVKNG